MDFRCGACWQSVREYDSATLIDKNSHTWYICPACITLLWKIARPNIAEELDSVTDQTVEAEHAIMQLATLVGSGQSAVDQIDREIAKPRSEWSKGVFEHVALTLTSALDHARKVYHP
jgi:hypothetical protein